MCKFKLPSPKLFAMALAISSTTLPVVAQTFSKLPAELKTLGGAPAEAEPGTELLVTVPLRNETTGPLTQTVGVVVPLTEKINVVNPVSDYGVLAPSGLAAGTSYRVKIADDARPGDRHDLKLGVKSGDTEQEFIVQFRTPGRRVYASWPESVVGAFSVAAAAGANATSLLVAGGTTAYGGYVYRNVRSGELVVVHAASNGTATVRRGQYGTVAPSDISAGDTFEFEGVAIPDAVRSGVLLKGGRTSELPQPGDPMKVSISAINHRVAGELVISLEAENPSTSTLTSATLMANPDGGYAMGGDITDLAFDDGATTIVTTELATGGRYRPLSSFLSIEPAIPVTTATIGLRIGDTHSGNLGYIRSWALELGDD